MPSDITGGITGAEVPGVAASRWIELKPGCRRAARRALPIFWRFILNHSNILLDIRTGKEHPLTHQAASKAHGHLSAKSKHHSARNFERLGQNPRRQSADAVHRNYAGMPAELSRLLRLRRHPSRRRQTPDGTERFSRRRTRQWRASIGS